MSDDDMEDGEELLRQLNEREEENQRKCYRRSSVRLAQEMRRHAKAQQRLVPYMQACFRVMVNSASLFDAAAGRDASIELIRLLESGDQARRIEPELSEGEYENAIHWMSSCAYDNLAENTAELLGYNSEGMHQCINDGIQVCRRTGKMQCISCFREYAAMVYCAADDMEMAVHFAQQAVDNPNPASEARRWASSNTLLKLLVRSGDLQRALQTLPLSWQLIDSYHSPLDARHKTFGIYSEIMALMGQAVDPQLEPSELPPRDEYPYLHMQRDFVSAVHECMSGDAKSAVERLIPWDTELHSRGQLNSWFQARLRLLCALRIAGDNKRLQALSQELEQAARTARDWYTLRCLAQINDPNQPATPVPSSKPFNLGPLAPQGAGMAAAATPATNAAAEATNSASPSADASAQVPELPEDLQPLAMVIMTIAQHQQFGMEVNADEVRSARGSLLASQADQQSALHRVHWLLHLMTFVTPPPGDADAERTWQWAQQLSALNSGDAVTLNLFATIACQMYLNHEPGLGDAPITKEQIAEMMRRSLDMDATRASNFERAGEFFARIGEDSEAERCFARAFRLDRARTSAALSLADIYARSDRPNDALEVLDLSLREGKGDARAAWQAAVLSSYLQKYEAALTYLNRFAQDAPDNPWLYFYRAQACLALQRSDEALAAARKFAEGEPERGFTIKLLQTAAIGQTRDRAATVASLEQFLSEKLSTVDYMASQALAKLFDFLWSACEWLSDSEPARQQLLSLMISSGMTPERYFEALRTARPKEEGISFYVVQLTQPLPEGWSELGCCGPGQQDWKSYSMRYGVLSTSQAKAERIAMEFQTRSGLGPASLQDVQTFDQEYIDSPGIVWQSVPESEQQI